MTNRSVRSSAQDVIVVGGGPAGSAAGKCLADRGLSTLLIEKHCYPREKPCGGLLSGRCIDAAESIFGAGTVAAVSKGELAGCRLYRKDKPIAEITDGPRMVFTRREAMDALLLRKAADAGCDVREDTEVTSVRPARSEVILASGETLRASVIIGADGAGSVVARCTRPRSRRSRRHAGFGLVAEAPIDVLKDEDASADVLPRIYLDALPWGYGWVFPRDGGVSIGIGRMLGRRTDFRRRFRHFVDMTCRPGTWERLDVRGHHLPFGCSRRRPGRANVLLTGDAAGLVEPLTGEGISFALESGRLAASAAADALADGAPTQAGRRYNALAAQHLLPHLRDAALARWAFFPRPILPLALCLLGRDANRVRWYLELLAGQTSYADYFRRLVASAGRQHFEF